MTHQPRPPLQVGTRVPLAGRDGLHGRICSVHRLPDGEWEYVVHTDRVDGRHSAIVNLRSDSPRRSNVETTGERVSAPDDVGRTWSKLAARMGYTSEEPQRQEILAAIARMSWTELGTDAALPNFLDGQAVRAIVAAIYHRRRRQLRLAGVAQLNGGRQLVGVQGRNGERHFLLDMDAEAIHVLAEIAPATSTRNVA